MMIKSIVHTCTETRKEHHWKYLQHFADIVDFRTVGAFVVFD